jgi:hypothetical protein
MSEPFWTSSETHCGLVWWRTPSSGLGPASLPSLPGRPKRCSIPVLPRAELTGSKPSMPRCSRPSCRPFVGASSATRPLAPSRGFCRRHPLWDFSPPSDNAAIRAWDDAHRPVLEKRSYPSSPARCGNSLCPPRPSPSTLSAVVGVIPVGPSFTCPATSRQHETVITKGGLPRAITTWTEGLSAARAAKTGMAFVTVDTGRVGAGKADRYVNPRGSPHIGLPR